MKITFSQAIIILLIILGLLGCNTAEEPVLEKQYFTAMNNNAIPETAKMTPTAMKDTTIKVTPESKFTENEKRYLISKLIENNGGCVLPCWWGITPGITPGNEAVTFLNELTDLIRIEDNTKDTFGDIIYFYNFYYSGEEHSITIGVDKQNIVSYLMVHNFKSISDTVHQLGVPQEVWFRSDFPLYFAVPVELDLFYLNDGVIIGFGDSGTEYYNNDIIKICRSDLDKNGTYLLLADPTRFSTYYSINLKLLGYLPDTRLVDGSFSDWTTQTLYEGLINGKEDACFTTKGEVWRQ